jgi:hypothetical protein
VRTPGALTVGDVNGDGFQDILVASNDTNAHSGIVTFLARFEGETPGSVTSQRISQERNQ